VLSMFSYLIVEEDILFEAESLGVDDFEQFLDVEFFVKGLVVSR
jgi:hypothetical protein